jgi:hypothetical protein
VKVLMAGLEPLVHCDVEACRTLVEPHVGRCADHVREYGPSPKKRQVAGHSLSGPKRPARWEEKSRKPKQWKPQRVPGGLNLPPVDGEEGA